MGENVLKERSDLMDKKVIEKKKWIVEEEIKIERRKKRDWNKESKGEEKEDRRNEERKETDEAKIQRC